jgi:hypothetical protein
MTIPFWSNEPTILFNKEYIFEFFPTTNMGYEQKLNAITRLIILITISGYILTMSLRILIVGLLTLFIIFIMFTMKKRKLTPELIGEGFINNDSIKEQMKQIKQLKREKELNLRDGSQSYLNPVTLDSVLKSEFKEGTKKNPFSNVLLTQIADDPERKSAPPSFNLEVEKDITNNVKRSVQMLNPEIKNTNKQLYGDLFQEFELTQSDRQFYSTPNSRVEPGDQTALGQFLYGNMPSAKESTMAGNIQREKDSYRHILR